VAEQTVSEKVVHVLFGALAPAIDQIRRAGDREANNLIGPTLTMAGALVLIEDLGADGAAAVLDEMVTRVRRGELDIPFSKLTVPVQ